jgi:Na+-driven multidrug efflux pump
MISLQAMGKGLPSLIISLSRQGLIFIPVILILNHLFGFNGFIYAQSATDFFTVILSLIFITGILRALKEVPAVKQAGDIAAKDKFKEQVPTFDS